MIGFDTSNERMFHFSPVKSIYANKSSKYLSTKNKGELKFKTFQTKNFPEQKIIQ